MAEEFCYTAAEVASLLKVSEDTILRRAKSLGGVIVAGSENGSIKKRRYRVWRFPKSAVEKYLTKLAGHPVVLQTMALPRGSRGAARRSEDWQNIAARRLAKAALANTTGIPARKLLHEIAGRARVYCFVPRDEWSELTFLEEEQEVDY